MADRRAMKAIVVSEFGGPGVLKVATVPVPKPGPGQLLVRVEAVGINPVETYRRSGAYARSPKLPYTPGQECSGVVVAVGEGAGAEFKVGQRVWQSGSVSGSYAQFNICDAKQHAQPLPARVSFASGAGISVAFRTAYRALFERARASAGETVLVHGASGGVGLAAVQLAKWKKLRVVGTAGTEKGLKLLKDQGCDAVLNHRTADRKAYQDAVIAACGGTGPDVVIEMLANKNLNLDMTVVARFGRIVVVGNRGTIDSVNPRLLMQKEATVVGVMLPGPAQEQSALCEIRKGLECGSLSPVVGTTFKLSEAPEAHIEVIEHKTGACGRIVLLPQE